MTLWTASILFACTPDERERDNQDDETRTPPVDTSDVFSCPEPELVVDGEDPPGVGDTWTVWMWCDDTLMQGTMILRTDPTDFAFIDRNSATFRYEGKGTVRLQVGTIVGEREVTVLADD